MVSNPRFPARSAARTEMGYPARDNNAFRGNRELVVRD
jgi:hypothetical protein